MLPQLYHVKPSDSCFKGRGAIHKSLLPYLLQISFHDLSPDEARKIVMGNLESVLGDFVSQARAKGELK